MDVYGNSQNIGAEKIKEAACYDRVNSRQGSLYFCPLAYIERVLRDKNKCDIFVVKDIELNEAAVTYLDSKMIYARNSVYINARKGDHECRFVFAHELGHLALHLNVTANVAAFNDKREKEANAYARELLAPQHLLVEILTSPNRPNLDKFDKEMANRFGIPEREIIRQRQDIMIEARNKSLDTLYNEAIARKKKVERLFGR